MSSVVGETGGGAQADRGGGAMPWPVVWGWLLGGGFLVVGTGLRWFAPGFDDDFRLEDRMAPIAPIAPEATAPGSVPAAAIGLVLVTAAWLGLVVVRERAGARAILVVAGLCNAYAGAVLAIPTVVAAVTGRVVGRDAPWSGSVAEVPLHLSAFGLATLAVAVVIVRSRPTPARLLAAVSLLVTPILAETVALSAFWASHDDPRYAGVLSGIGYLVAGAAAGWDRRAWARGRTPRPRGDADAGYRAADRRIGWASLGVAGLLFVASAALRVALLLADGPGEPAMPDSRPAWPPVGDLVATALAVVASLLVVVGPWARRRLLARAAAVVLAGSSAFGVVVYRLLADESFVAALQGGSTSVDLESLSSVLLGGSASVLLLVAVAHRSPDGPWRGRRRAGWVSLAFALLLGRAAWPMVTGAFLSDALDGTSVLPRILSQAFVGGAGLCLLVAAPRPRRFADGRLRSRVVS